MSISVITKPLFESEIGLNVLIQLLLAIGFYKCKYCIICYWFYQSLVNKYYRVPIFFIYIYYAVANRLFVNYNLTTD